MNLYVHKNIVFLAHHILLFVQNLSSTSYKKNLLYLEDLNKKMEDGTAQLKQIVDSGELQKGLTDASEELSNVLKSGAVQTGLKNTVENSQEINLFL